MRRAALGLAAAVLLLALVVTTLIAHQAEALHARLMAQIQATGLAQSQEAEFARGWLRSDSHGALRLAPSLCAACERLNYQGSLHHGLGTLLLGTVALAQVDYRVRLPGLPLEPPLPALDLSARLGLDRSLSAGLGAPASQHQLDSGRHHYTITQQGLDGQFDGSQLLLRSPGLALARDADDWLALSALDLQARAAPAVELDGQAQRLTVPIWDWQAETLQLRYRQPELDRRLSFDLGIASPRGEIAGRAHGPTTATLAVERLDLAATRAFAAELPALLDPAVSRTARLFKLLSLYGLHGPALFAAAPRLVLQASALPLPEGPAEIDLSVAVKDGLRRPPMHPAQWRQALNARVDVRAAPERLASWWALAGPTVNYLTGLPRDFAQLQAAGWVQPLAAGRLRLAFRLQDGQLEALPAAP